MDVEEVDERLCEILQSLLLHDAGSFSQPWVLGTGGGQLSALVHEVDGTAPWLPPRALLESRLYTNRACAQCPRRTDSCTAVGYMRYR